MTDVTIVIEDCPRADFTMPAPAISPSEVTIFVGSADLPYDIYGANVSWSTDWGHVEALNDYFGDGYSAVHVGAQFFVYQGMAQTAFSKTTGHWNIKYKFPETGYKDVYFYPIYNGTDNRGGSDSYYIYLGSDGVLELHKKVSGVSTLLASSTHTYDGNTHEIDFYRDANGKMAVYLDGVLKITATDTSINANQRLYMNVWSGGGFQSVVALWKYREHGSTTLITFDASVNTSAPIINGLGICGTGTSTDPFQIWTFQDLELIGTTGYALSAYYKLEADIDASATADPSYNDGAGWLPIGTGSYFNGGFNGGGYTISGLYINRPTTDSVGLFGETRTSNITDVILTDCDITGQNNVGGIIGYSNGETTLTNLAVTGTVNGVDNVGGVIGHSYRSTHSYHHFSGTVTGSGANIGGVIGHKRTYSTSNYSVSYLSAEGKITGNTQVGGVIGQGERALASYCEFDGEVTGTTDVGGIFGKNRYAPYTNCTMTGIITSANGENVGGIAGNNYLSSFTDCTVDTITINASTSTRVGGLVGYSSRNSGDLVGFTNCSVSGASITGANETGGFAGFIGNPNITNCSFSGEVTGVDTVGGGFGKIEVGANITIYNEEFNLETTVTGTGRNLGAIAGSSGAGFDGFTIDSSNITFNTSITSEYVGGVVGYVNPNGTATITNCTVTIPITGYNYVGGIAGGTSSANVNLIIAYCDVNTTITGNNYIGGIIGRSDLYGASSEVSYCTVKGAINGSGSNIGGIAGFSARKLSNLSVDTDLTINASETSDYVGGIVGYGNRAPYFENCTCATPITGRDFVGGIMGGRSGLNENLTMVSCNTDTTITGRNHVGGIIGLHDVHGSGSSISDCTVKGTINATGNNVGGICGSSTRLITGITVYMTINAPNSNYVGGITGYVNRNCTITECTVTTPIMGVDYVGGIVGGRSATNDILQVSNCTINTTVSGRAFVGGIIGSGEMYHGSSKVNDCVVKGIIEGTGNYIGGVVGYCRIPLENLFVNRNDLTIVASSTSNYVGGIVGYARENTTFTNCGSDIDISGQDYIGGICGGTINSNAIINMTKCFYKGNVTGRNYLGGICGYLSAYNTGSNINTSYTIGSVAGTGDYIGGFVGYCNSPITNCYSHSDVTGASHVGGFCGRVQDRNITNVYSCGAVVGTSNTGGLVGSKNTGTATDCFWDTQTSGQATSALGTGKITAEMKTQSTFTNWDFSTPIWKMDCYNEAYPYLNFQGIGSVCAETCTSTYECMNPSIVIGASGPSITIQPDTITSTYSMDSPLNVVGIDPTIQCNTIESTYTHINPSIDTHINTYISSDAFSSNFDIFTPEISCDAIIDMETCESELSLNEPGISYGTKTESEPIKAQYETPTSQITNGQGTTITSAIADSTYSTPASETGCGATTEVEVCATFYEIPEPNWEAADLEVELRYVGSADRHPRVGEYFEMVYRVYNRGEDIGQNIVGTIQIPEGLEINSITLFGEAPDQEWRWDEDLRELYVQASSLDLTYEYPYQQFGAIINLKALSSGNKVFNSWGLSDTSDPNLPDNYKQVDLFVYEYQDLQPNSIDSDYDAMTPDIFCDCVVESVICESDFSAIIPTVSCGCTVDSVLTQSNFESTVPSIQCSVTTEAVGFSSLYDYPSPNIRINALTYALTQTSTYTSINPLISTFVCVSGGISNSTFTSVSPEIKCSCVAEINPLEQFRIETQTPDICYGYTINPETTESEYTIEEPFLIMDMIMANMFIYSEFNMPEPHATTPPSQVYRYTFIFEPRPTYRFIFEPRPTYRFIIEPKKFLQFIMEDQE